MRRPLPGRIRTLGLWALLSLCIVAWVTPQRSLDYRRMRWPDSYPLLLLPSGRYLQAASLGHQMLLADIIYLWSIQYYGHHRASEGRRHLWHIFDVITDLDLRFMDAYLTGALIMAVDMFDVELAIRLLEKGMRNNPEEWILPLEAGFYSQINLEDYERAASYYERAMELPGAPPTVARLRAGMVEYAGRLEEALAFWVEVHEGTDDERVRSIAWQHIYDIKVNLDLRALGAAIDEFRSARGRPPRVLAALVSNGYLSHIPRTPDDDPYDYNPVTGEVTDPRQGRDRAQR